MVTGGFLGRWWVVQSTCGSWEEFYRAVESLPVATGEELLHASHTSRINYAIYMQYTRFCEPIHVCYKKGEGCERSAR